MASCSLFCFVVFFILFYFLNVVVVVVVGGGGGGGGGGKQLQSIISESHRNPFSRRTTGIIERVMNVSATSDDYLKTLILVK